MDGVAEFFIRPSAMVQGFVKSRVRGVSCFKKDIILLQRMGIGGQKIQPLPFDLHRRISGQYLLNSLFYSIEDTKQLLCGFRFRCAGE